MLHGTWSGNVTVDKGWSPSHLECLNGRGNVFSICENVHLLTNPLVLALGGFPNVARGAPPCLERVGVDHPFCKLSDTHEGSCLLDTVQDLCLLLSLLVHFRHFVGCRGREMEGGVVSGHTKALHASQCLPSAFFFSSVC